MIKILIITFILIATGIFCYLLKKVKEEIQRSEPAPEIESKKSRKRREGTWFDGRQL